jgi:uncharacterized membrane protein
MQLLPGWHPLIVHFPLALIVTAAAALTAAQGWRSPRLAETLAVVGTWNLCLGAVGVLFALGSGLAAAIDLPIGPATHQAISAHVKSAILTTVLVLPAALWRGVGVAPTSRPSWIFLILLWLATASLIVTGYRGGQNVYRYGVGVSALTEPGSP